MAKKLILFTSGFPFGSSEPFLETEILYLSKAFEEVIILCPFQHNPIARKVPSNCTVKTYDNKVNRIKSIFGIFSPMVFNEFNIVKKIYCKKMSLGILKTMLISHANGKRIEHICTNELQTISKENELIFYSYWCDDSALGLALFRNKNKDYKCFTRMHGWDVYFEVSSVNYLPFRHFIADNLTALFPISEKGKNYISETWKIVNNSTVKVARLGVNKQDYSIRKFSIFTIVSCSNMIPLKRIHLIVEALSEIKDVQIQWFHFGDGPLMNEIMSIAKKSLPKNVQANFMGRINNQELMEWYSAHQPDVFMNVSSSEGIPVSIMEAMSFGIPAIATDVGGTAELVNEKNGVLLQANPIISDIKKAILFFINLSKSTQIELSEEAKSKWRNEYDAEKNYTTFVSRM